MNGSDGKISPQEAAHYIAEMTAEMRNIAHDAGLEFLVYLLEMAHEEAYKNNLEIARKNRE